MVLIHYTEYIVRSLTTLCVIVTHLISIGLNVHISCFLVGLFLFTAFTLYSHSVQMQYTKLGMDLVTFGILSLPFCT